MHATSLLDPNSTSRAAIYFCGTYASRALASGHTDLVAIAKTTIKQAHSRGYQSSPDEKCTRFTGKRRNITRFQDELYAVNEDPDWQFPDRVLDILWLIECGGPAMGRGPSGILTGAPFHTNVKKYIGGTRGRYNRGTHNHKRLRLPESREYPEEECPHFESS